MRRTGRSTPSNSPHSDGCAPVPIPRRLLANPRGVCASRSARCAARTSAGNFAWLAHSDAVILDLRFNPGGIGGFTPALASYFMPEPDAELFYRRTRSERRVYTTDRHAGGVWSAKPLYILISDTTGSAAENLAYTLQQHGRATLVGENSGRGGGHSATMVRLVDGFVLADR